MSDGSSTTSGSSSASPSGPHSPPGSPSGPMCWAAHVTGLGIALAVAIPIGRVLPDLLQLAFKDPCNQWKPLVAALLALGMVAAPADTLRFARRLIPFGKGADGK